MARAMVEGAGSRYVLRTVSFPSPLRGGARGGGGSERSSWAKLLYADAGRFIRRDPHP